MSPESDTFTNLFLTGAANVCRDGDNPAVALDAPAPGRASVTIPAANRGISGRSFSRLVASPD